MAIVPGVVGHYLTNRDVVVGEEHCSISKKPCAGWAFLVRECLSESEPGMVVNGDVDIVEPHAASPTNTMVIKFCWSVDSPTTTVGDPAEFLHVDVDQLTRVLALVTVVRAARRTNPDAGDRVELVERGQPGTSDDP